MAAMPDVLDATPLTLVRWRPEDVDDMLEAVRSSIDELKQWMPWAQTMPTRAEQQAVLIEASVKFDAGTEFQYVFRETATDALVGAGGIHRRLGPRAVEIGYWVRTDRQNRGYATRAAQAMTDAVFGYLEDVDGVEIHMDRANPASARVPEKLGYEIAGTEQRERTALASTDEGLVWRTTRIDWARRSARPNRPRS